MNINVYKELCQLSSTPLPFYLQWMKLTAASSIDVLKREKGTCRAVTNELHKNELSGIARERLNIWRKV